MTEYSISSEKEMRELGSELTRAWRVGDIVLLSGELGAGKTTLVRGVLEALNWEGAVRSPSFTLMQVYPTKVPVLHADLYRLAGAAGIGLEEYFEDHLCLIEWPDRLGDLVDPAECWRVQIDFNSEGRKVEVCLPTKYPLATPDQIAGIPKEWGPDYTHTLKYFPTLEPSFYSSQHLFATRDYFTYLSNEAQLALLPAYYRAAVFFAEQGDLSAGHELLHAHDGPEVCLFRLFKNYGTDFNGYQEIHEFRERFLKLWRATIEDQDLIDDDFSDEPFL